MSHAAFASSDSEDLTNYSTPEHIKLKQTIIYPRYLLCDKQSNLTAQHLEHATDVHHGTPKYNRAEGTELRYT